MKTGRRWIKLWKDLLEGTTIEELTPEERWVWIGLLLMANDDGVVMRGSYSDGRRMGYSLEALSHRLYVSQEVVLRTLEKCKRFEKLDYEVTEVEGIKGYVITIRNWKKYQTTYDEKHKRYYEKRKEQKRDVGWD
jgi:Zn-dependent peptidase ImmA (M78 family)